MFSPVHIFFDGSHPPFMIIDTEINKEDHYDNLCSQGGKTLHWKMTVIHLSPFLLRKLSQNIHSSKRKATKQQNKLVQTWTTQNCILQTFTYAWMYYIFIHHFSSFMFSRRYKRQPLKSAMSVATWRIRKQKKRKLKAREERNVNKTREKKLTAGIVFWGKNLTVETWMSLTCEY